MHGMYMGKGNFVWPALGTFLLKTKRNGQVIATIAHGFSAE